RKTREKSEAIRRARKLARKKAQREGLIPPDARKKKLLDAKKTGQRPALRPFPSF
ncbi:MAG TPA: 30S ribosomal protein S21, partial [Pseudolabrys sp.]|nr:30S ribosomal protein S21 [Pseudolabrys sp.]